MTLEFNKEKFSNILPAPTLPLSQKVNLMRKKGLNVIDFGAGDPGFTTPDLIIESAYRNMKNGATHYAPSAGLPELKEAVKKKLLEENGLDYALDEIVITHGAKGAIYNLLRVICDRGDEVIVPVPCYPGYEGMILLAGAVPKMLMTSEEDDFKLTVSVLDRAITDKTKVIIINSPSNPVGTVYTKKELETLAEYLQKKQVFVLSDEIYEKILYGESEHVSFASLGKEVNDFTFTVNGFSKTYAMTGWRVGYIAGASSVISTIVKLQSQSLSSLAPFSQLACVSALESDQKCVREMVAEYTLRKNAMCRRLAGMGLTFPKPEGAFYVFPNIAAYLTKSYEGTPVKTSFEFANLLLEKERVALLFGPAFGIENYLRLTFATTALDELETGMNRLEKFLGDFR